MSGDREIVIKVRIPEDAVAEIAPVLDQYIAAGQPLLHAAADRGCDISVVVDGQLVESTSTVELPEQEDDSDALSWFSQPKRRTYQPLPDGRIPFYVMLGVGDQAHAVTPWHTPKDPMILSTAAIAADCNMPANEVVGREYTATGDEHGLRDFALVNDPRV
ncbi:hypothetical protein [Nocardia sp. CA-290969]|uniref:hypothetical protein n=1 Tax=Nocardia sp. CA-290969 TaxID=3239986 RepID=UPI003D94D7C8